MTVPNMKNLLILDLYIVILIIRERIIKDSIGRVASLFLQLLIVNFLNPNSLSRFSHALRFFVVVVGRKKSNYGEVCRVVVVIVLLVAVVTIISTSNGSRNLSQALCSGENNLTLLSFSTVCVTMKCIFV
jgi:threonine/homoserine/homoserine lactone efflux protein